jgi:hypothetical protein
LFARLRADGVELSGVKKSYKSIVDLLGTRAFGTPFRNVKKLERWGVSVTIDYLTLMEIERTLKEGLPVLAGVHTADLAYWVQGVDHVVVVIGLDEQNVYVNDPSLPQSQQPIPKVQFDLAQLAFDNLCAIIR